MAEPKTVRRSSAERPHISTQSFMEKVPQLVGQLNSDGTVALEADPLYSPPTLARPPRSLKVALEAAKDSRRASSPDVSSESDSLEDYDALKHDPMAVVIGGKGGGFGPDPKMKPLESGNKKTYEAIKSPSEPQRPSTPRLKSIPVTLNKLKEKGKYVLTADDEALRKILRLSVERVCHIMKKLELELTAFLGKKSRRSQTKEQV